MVFDAKIDFGNAQHFVLQKGEVLHLVRCKNGFSTPNLFLQRTKYSKILRTSDLKKKGLQ